MVALVDDEDFWVLNKYKWHTYKSRKKYIYAARRMYLAGKRKFVLMHREILCPLNSKDICDHKDGNGLNNQRSNLRLCLNAENVRNQKRRKDNSSGFKGVYWSKVANKWQSYIKFNNKRIHLGLFECKVKAAKAYDMAAKKHHGEFAKLNFPE